MNKNFGKPLDIDYVKKNFEDLFSGLGTFEEPYSITMKENAIPVARPPRRVPLKLIDKLRNKLNELEERGIIAKVGNGNEWVGHIVTVEKKDGSLRICLDPQELNKNIVNENFLLPTLDELSTKLRDMKYFSVMDLKDGFWHVKLDERSQNLCTFATPFGNYKFLRMPFGIKPGPQVFQNRNMKNFGDIGNVFVYSDDILITGKTEKEHDETLLKVLNRARECGVKFNISKMKIKENRVKYLGHIFSENSILPDPDRIIAIKEMGYPKDKNDLMKFLGVVNYLRAFIPNLAELTSPLRELIKKNVIFSWQNQQSDAVEQIKAKILEAPVLIPFDQNRDIRIECDASKNGLGCCMFQDGKPISFASRSLTDSEKNYSQIEKEFLSILFACKKFHFFTYGRKVRIVNDHKPLLGIMKKEIHKIPSSKLQRIRLKLLNYDIDLEYAPGKTIHIADYLSRYMRQTDEKGEDEIMTDSVMSINVSDERKNEFKIETEHDQNLKILKTYCMNGWPDDKTKCHETLKYYYKIKNEIFLEEEILFYNERIIVPLSMRKAILNQLHESHFGITKTIKRAKEIVYWPNLNNDIIEKIGECTICQLNAPKNQKEPLIPHEVPDKAFDKVGCDILEFENKNYLVVVDYYSKWIELSQMKGKQASNVNAELMQIFSHFGIPKIVIADNMPFGSYECTEFAKKLDFKIITSSPHYPKSNGLAERSVQICKNILRKTNNFFEMQKALLEYRSTPTQFMTYSPAQLVQNRNLRTSLPAHVNKFKPKLCTEDVVKMQIQKKTIDSKKYYDRNAKFRHEFNIDDKVYMWNANRWVPGVIIKQLDAPRSYLVTANNKQYRRNSRDIRIRVETSPSIESNKAFNSSQSDINFQRKRLRNGKEY